jgi:hypothetical protein
MSAVTIALSQTYPSLKCDAPVARTKQKEGKGKRKDSIQNFKELFLLFFRLSSRRIYTIQKYSLLYTIIIIMHLSGCHSNRLSTSRARTSDANGPYV